MWGPQPGISRLQEASKVFCLAVALLLSPALIPVRIVGIALVLTGALVMLAWVKLARP